LGILTRNWHLKLSAVLLSTVLYTGLVFSGSFSDASIQVRVEQANVSPNTFVVTGDLGLVEITYRAANDIQSSVTASDFVARVDLSGYDMEQAPEPQQLPVEVSTLRDGIRVLSVEPNDVRVEVDRIEVRTIPVEVEPGPIPDGLEIGDPVVSDDEVEVRGPASVVNQIDRAQALVDIPASGIDVNDAIDLTLVDIEDQPVGTGMVDVEPETVSVQIDVSAVETETTVAIRPDVEAGTPAPGFALDALSVDPASVTIVGLPEVLAEVEAVLTQPISIDGASSDQTLDVELVLPDGVSLADGEPSSVTVTATIVPSVSSRTFVVGVVCQGSGDNSCVPRIDQLSITLSGEGEALDGLDASAITPVVDASGLDPGSYSLTPAVSGLPEGVSLVGISPASVPVTITAPAPTPAPAP
jgi:YbbR domain-containing protein